MRWNSVTPKRSNCGRSSGRSRIGTVSKMRGTTPLSHCGRSSGRSRIGTPHFRSSPTIASIAVALRGDRGLERPGIDRHFYCSDCGRSSGRSRIGTIGPFSTPSSIMHCGRSSGRSRIGTLVGYPSKSGIPIAVALRGDRGLEPIDRAESNRPKSIAVALRGDRGLERVAQLHYKTTTPLRSLFGAIEDWNCLYSRSTVALKALRSLFGAIEDWNLPRFETRCRLRIAVALRGDRGLEQYRF